MNQEENEDQCSNQVEVDLRTGPILGIGTARTLIELLVNS